jgi:Trypsin-like peptidase domain
MAEPVGSEPVDDVWTAAVHAEDSIVPLGAAVVIDDRRLLTCAHVVLAGAEVRPRLEVTFPKADDAWGERRQVRQVRLVEPANLVDLAVLVLNEPVPAGVAAAPLRCPRPVDLVNRRWSTFGFLTATQPATALTGWWGYTSATD